jgi:hypothetical protein
MIELSPAVDALFPALHKAQSTLTGVVKDGKNPAFKSRYATLENVIDAAKPALQSAELAFTQAPGALVDGAIEITTMLMHTSGQWLRSTLHVPLSKRDPQGVGSAITYGCRYALMATLGLPPVDDDAESAMDRSPPRAAPPVERAPSLSQSAIAFKFGADKAKSADELKQWMDDVEPELSKLPPSEVAHVKDHARTVWKALAQKEAA